MKVLGMTTALGLTLLIAAAWGQSPPSSAKVESAPLELSPPDRFQVAAVLEPIRQVTILATADGLLRTMEAQVGAAVREGQTVATLDRAEAAARLKVAQAHVKEMQAAVKTAPQGQAGVVKAQLEAAQARAELAQLELDRCTLRAPFAGRLLDAPVFDGQFVTKGTALATLADVSSLRALIPLDRAAAAVGATVTVTVEGRPVEGKVKATLPLAESAARLRELAAPFASAWVVIPNTKGEFEPGQRVLSPSLPTAPIATIPARALQTSDEDKNASMVQVIRNEYVTNVRVHVLGHPGPERVQVSGPLRPSDALIVSTSVPLLAGTLIRFSGAARAGAPEATSPNPTESGAVADISPPYRPNRTATATSTAPAPTPTPAATRPTPTPSRPSTPAAARPATKPAAKPAANTVPF